MTFFNWARAVEAMKKLIGPVTDSQKRIARIARLNLEPDLPRIVAGARLQSALEYELGIVGPVHLRAKRLYRDD
jgi:hypothetical protein